MNLNMIVNMSVNMKRSMNKIDNESDSGDKGGVGVGERYRGTCATREGVKQKPGQKTNTPQTHTLQMLYRAMALSSISCMFH